MYLVCVEDNQVAFGHAQTLEATSEITCCACIQARFGWKFPFVASEPLRDVCGWALGQRETPKTSLQSPESESLHQE
jgi:hypothetical protein